jgi:hypothetical protein
MRLACFLLLVVGAWPVPGVAQSTEVDKIANTMVRLCVGGGHTDATNTGVTGRADLSLRSFDAKGNVKGQYKVSRSSAEGLINGLDNALSQVAADQADKVRECLKPVRERLLEVMLPSKSQGSAGPTVSAPGGVAVGRDVTGSPITVNPPPKPPGK